MRMKKSKTGLILLSLILTLGSLPASAAEVEDSELLEETLQKTTEMTDSVNPAAEKEEEAGEQTKESEPENLDQSEETESGQEKEDVAQETVSDSRMVYDLEAEETEVRIKGGQTEYTYTGSEIKPEFEVIYRQADGKEISLGMEHFKAEYQNNINAGEASLTLTGEDESEEDESGEDRSEAGETETEEDKDSYIGTRTLKFKIVPAAIGICQLQMSKTVAYTGKQVKPSVILTYNGVKLSAGKDYTLTYSNNIKIGTASVQITGAGNFTGTRTEKYNIKLASPNVKLTSNYSRVKLTWKKVKSADGYQIYRSTSVNGKYKKVKTYTSGSKVSYSDTKAKFNKNYYYKVRAYQKVTVKVNGKKKTKTIYSPWSTVVSGKKKLGRSTVKSAKCVSRTSAKVTWKKVTGAQGYCIYKCETKNGTYTYAGTAKGAGKTSYTVKKLKSGVQYYFKVRAYRKSGSKQCYGAFSAAKKETITVDQRLYILFPNGVPTTKAQMEKYLVTITVPIQDENGLPNTLELRVHKNLTKEFMGAFIDMYAIGFPVRAEDTDTYSWRSMASSKNRSHHSYGCVVDINWNSNPMIGVTEGKYRPGVDPYSVTPEVVKIWKKHGFYWGGDWKSTKDYMHFSYTNH